MKIRGQIKDKVERKLYNKRIRVGKDVDASDDAQLKIGLTGGIGSGKSTAARMFQKLGVIMYYTDIRAKVFISKPEIQLAITEKLGDHLYKNDHIQSQELAAIIFNDPEKLKWINDLMYPYVANEFIEWCEMWKDSVCMIESAILIESNSLNLDAIIVVVCPEEDRIERAMKRDGATREAIVARLKNQLIDEERIEHADYVMHNTGDTEFLEKQVLDIFNKISGN